MAGSGTVLPIMHSWRGEYITSIKSIIYYIYIYICVCVCVCMCLYRYVRTHVFMYTRMCFVYILVCVYMYVCMYIYMYAFLELVLHTTSKILNRLNCLPTVRA